MLLRKIFALISARSPPGLRTPSLRFGVGLGHQICDHFENANGFFNLTNPPHFANPNGSITRSAFGMSPAGSRQDGSQPGSISL